MKAHFAGLVVLICVLSEVPSSATIPVLQKGKQTNYSRNTIRQENSRNCELPPASKVRVYEAHKRGPKEHQRAAPGRIILLLKHDITCYLKRYGYLNNRYRQIDILNAVKQFQTFFGLASTGELTEMTKEIMSESRCSEKDIGSVKPHTTKKFITYSIASWTGLSNRIKVNQTIANAFAIWRSKQPLHVQWVNESESNVLIIFNKETPNHGCKNINEPMKILFTNSSFNVYIKEDIINDTPTLFKICYHAFGHILGHGHEGPFSSMSPLFSSRTKKNLAFPKALRPRKICNSVKSIKSIFSYLYDGNTYLFKNSQFWKLTVNNVAEKGYPKNIADHWRGVPDNFDEVMVWGMNWRTYFFKGRSYYRYDGTLNRVDSDYPIPIHRGWVNVPDNIDAAFTDENRFTYFLKGKLIYYYDNTLSRVGDGYPKNITDVYPNLPGNIDTAFRSYSDGETYFFKGKNYYKWNKKEGSVKGPFPITSKWKNICLAT